MGSGRLGFGHFLIRLVISDYPNIQRMLIVCFLAIQYLVGFLFEEALDYYVIRLLQYASSSNMLTCNGLVELFKV